MSKGKHTPGPWRFKEYVEFPADVKEELERSGREIPRFRFLTNDGQAAITSDHADNAIAYVQCQTKFKRGMGHKAECEMRDANARLIAAAPELLEVLKAFPGFIDDATIGDDWIERAWAAIAKAEGRA